MAGQLVPELLGRSATVADGAPIVGPDGIVESGNGRVLALRRAYGDIALVEKLLEEDEGGLGPLGRALLDAAPKWAAMEDAAGTTALIEAVRAVVRQRDSGQPLHFALEQADAFGGGLSADARAFHAAFLHRDPKTQRSRLLARPRLGKLLEAYVEEASRHEGESLPGADRPTPGQIVAAVDKRARKELGELLAELGLDPETATAADIRAAMGRKVQLADRRLHRRGVKVQRCFRSVGFRLKRSILTILSARSRALLSWHSCPAAYRPFFATERSMPI